MIKKIGFLTGTRADYGKIKTLIDQINLFTKEFELHILVTGMHLDSKYGSTVNHIISDNLGQIHFLPNHVHNKSMEITLARTIEQLSDFLTENKLDLLIVHGDRVETLAGAITCTLMNIPVGHIEGGELSGTVDGIIRHSISKLVHLHFVANFMAKKRLMQLGESPESIFVIGSPDVDVILSDNLPSLEDTKRRYQIYFEEYSIFIFHPVTNEVYSLEKQINEICSALKKSDKNYVVISPNNDLGTEIIQRALEKNLTGKRFVFFPSMRFENFLTLLKNCQFIIGNSSAGIREAGYYGVPCVNIGTRQKSRHESKLIIDADSIEKTILEAIKDAQFVKRIPEAKFGKGNSAVAFVQILRKEDFWPIPTIKEFVDINFLEENNHA